MNYVAVFIGGGLGSLVRYGLALTTQKLGYASMWATLVANVCACFIIGVLSAQFAKGTLSETQRLLFATGFCGGFSTFSTFSNETWASFNNGQTFVAVANIALSLVLCLLATFLGLLWVGAK